MEQNTRLGGGQAPTGDGQGDKAMRTKLVALGAALMLIAFGATGCGKRGPLEPPPDSAKTAEAKPAEADGEAIEKRGEHAEDTHEPFILDVLL